jgi:RNA polymerase sigma-70 factor (ECF subfamily)
MGLLERFARGDVEAFEALFRQHVEAVYGWVIGIVRDRSSAEDVTIEAFWRMYRARTQFDPSRAFEPWARRVATNVALSHLRSSRPAVSLDWDVAAPAQPDAAEQDDTRMRIREAFAELPALLRGVATLALIEDRPYREIADGFGISESAVKTRVFRAVRALRKSLKRKGVTP